MSENDSNCRNNDLWRLWVITTLIVFCCLCSLVLFLQVVLRAYREVQSGKSWKETLEKKKTRTVLLLTGLIMPMEGLLRIWSRWERRKGDSDFETGLYFTDAVFSFFIWVLIYSLTTWQLGAAFQGSAYAVKKDTFVRLHAATGVSLLCLFTYTVLNTMNVSQSGMGAMVMTILAMIGVALIFGAFTMITYIFQRRLTDLVGIREALSATSKIKSYSRSPRLAPSALVQAHVQSMDVGSMEKSKGQKSRGKGMVSLELAAQSQEPTATSSKGRIHVVKLARPRSNDKNNLDDVLTMDSDLIRMSEDEMMDDGSAAGGRRRVRFAGQGPAEGAAEGGQQPEDSKLGVPGILRQGSTSAILRLSAGLERARGTTTDMLKATIPNALRTSESPSVGDFDPSMQNFLLAAAKQSVMCAWMLVSLVLALAALALWSVSSCMAPLAMVGHVLASASMLTVTLSAFLNNRFAKNEYEKVCSGCDKWCQLISTHFAASAAGHHSLDTTSDIVSI